LRAFLAVISDEKLLEGVVELSLDHPLPHHGEDGRADFSKDPSDKQSG